MIFVQSNLFKNYWKYQNTFEISTYGSELMTTRLAVEKLLEIRYRLKMKAFKIEKCSTILGEKSFFKLICSSNKTLKKETQIGAFLKIKISICCWFCRCWTYWWNGNQSDIKTKPVSPSEFYKHTGTVIFGRISKDDQCYPRRSYITKYKESLVKAMYWLILHHTGITTGK